MTEIQATVQPQPSLGQNSAVPDSTQEPDQQKKEKGKEDTSAAQDWAPFSDSTISFAIDTSGSTLGTILQCEQQAVRSISAILSNSAKDAARVLPWSSQAHEITTLSRISSLSSYGGTDPSALLDDNSCLAALQNSTLWFLITDGEIPESSLGRFARELSLSGLHGTACVIMVFGVARGSPSNCNISVGVSVFAAAPDCLFLFMDINNGCCYLLQCKGTFTEILEQRKQQQPVLDEKTKWGDLPQISLDDLGSVRVPKHRNLQADEVYLAADLVVNLNDLFSGLITDRKVIDTILDSQEHIRTITMTAQTRGLAGKLRDWVVKQELDPVELLSANAPKVDEKTTKSMATLMQRMDSHSSFYPDEQYIPRLQAEIRAANSAYSTTFQSLRAASSEKAMHRGASITSVVDRSHSSIVEAKELSFNRLKFPKAKDFEVPAKGLLTPGFYIPNAPGKHFENTCPLCAEDKTTLALLLREPPQTQATHDFPATGSNSNLAFPLAMGNFRETDIICQSLYCDTCSYSIVQSGGDLGEDKVICALPLVSYTENKKAYNRQLKMAFQDRFDEGSTPLVFVAVLCTALQRAESQNKRGSKLLANALRWACQDIVQSVMCPNPLTWTPSKGDDIPQTKPLSDVLVKSAEDAVRAVSVSYFQYPIEGFIVATKLLNEMVKTQPQSQNTAKKAVFQRLLFHVTEQFDKQIDEQGRLLVHVTMARLLILERGRRERAANTPGILQASFNGLAGLTRNIFGDRKSLRDRLAISFDDLVAASLLDQGFLKDFKKLGPLYDWVESQSGHAVAIFVHYLYRSNNESWKSSDAQFLGLAKTPALAPVFLEPSEISAGKAERLIGKLPPFDTVGTTSN